MAVQVAQIDAFAEKAFTGNPAGVCLLDRTVDDEWMQRVAAELNLPETAFLVPIELESGDQAWRLRWFTPTVEVELCGHATLAAAHHLWSSGIADQPVLHFVTLSGELTASRRKDGWIRLDFPANVAIETDPCEAVLDALGVTSGVIGAARGSHFDLIELASAAAVRDLDPDLVRLAKTDTPAFIVTAIGDGLHDIVSRVFAPSLGVDEDWVTGSAHCLLGPYWAPKLGKTDLLAYQASRRGGLVRVGIRDDRVMLEGRAVTVFTTELADVALPPRPKVPKRQARNAVPA